MVDEESSFDQHFVVLGQRVHVRCESEEVARMVHGNMGALGTDEPSSAPNLAYTVSGRRPYQIYRQAQNDTIVSSSRSDLLYDLEKDVIFEVQYLRPELYFIHSAVVAWQGRASMFVAESGGGKSTTTWALLHHGYEYLSDEVAPIALDALHVLPYPRAVCLKRSPPRSYPLPAETMRLSWSLHIPTTALPARVAVDACPLDAIFLLQHDPKAQAPSLLRITAAEAAARMFVHALNTLAHPNMGLDAVLRIASHARCYALTTARLPDTCALVGSVLRKNGANSV